MSHWDLTPQISLWSFGSSFGTPTLTNSQRGSSLGSVRVHSLTLSGLFALPGACDVTPESTFRPAPCNSQHGSSLRVWGLIPSHSLHSREYVMWLPASSWPAPLQPLLPWSQAKARVATLSPTRKRGQCPHWHLEIFPQCNCFPLDSRFGLPGLWDFVAPCPNLQLGQGLNQSCSPQRELSNAMLQS
jgi:hypothetical protein